LQQKPALMSAGQRRGRSIVRCPHSAVKRWCVWTHSDVVRRMIYLYFRIVWKLLPLARQGWLGPLDASREVQLNLAGARGRGSSGPSVQHLAGQAFSLVAPQHVLGDRQRAGSPYLCKARRSLLHGYLCRAKRSLAGAPRCGTWKVKCPPLFGLILFLVVVLF